MAEAITPITIGETKAADKQVISGVNIRLYRGAVAGRGDMADCAVSLTISKGTGDAPNFQELTTKEVAISQTDFLRIFTEIDGMALFAKLKAQMIADGTWE